MVYIHIFFVFPQSTVIAFAEQQNTDEKDADSEDEDGDDSDSDGDGGGDLDEQEQHSQLGDVKQQLENGGLKYHSLVMDPELASRTKEAYQHLEGKVGVKAFPRNKRFCSVMDFRKEDGDQSDNFFVFRPVEGSDNVKQNPSSLNYFNNAKTSILPADSDQKQNDDDDGDIESFNVTTTGPQITVCESYANLWVNGT